MRLIDADALYNKAETWYKNAPTPYRKIYRSLVDAVADSPTIAPPPNDPLTLEQLGEMDGEPVWVEHDGTGKWVIASSEPIEILRRLGDTPYLLSVKSYGIAWRAYRRKPEAQP